MHFECKLLKFSPGQTVATRGVMALGEEIEGFMDDLSYKYHEKYLSGDWGEICDKDKEQNEIALNHGLRLMGAYTVKGHKVWIITEHDRSVTTLLLPEEY